MAKKAEEREEPQAEPYWPVAACEIPAGDVVIKLAPADGPIALVIGSPARVANRHALDARCTVQWLPLLDNGRFTVQLVSGKVAGGQVLHAGKTVGFALKHGETVECLLPVAGE
jgi:hypothetical protein